MVDEGLYIILFVEDRGDDGNHDDLVGFFYYVRNSHIDKFYK